MVAHNGKSLVVAVSLKSLAINSSFLHCAVCSNAESMNNRVL